MDRNEIEAIVIDAIKEILNNTETNITAETNLRDDLSINSMDTMNLAMELEERFDEYEVEIPDEAVYGLTTVASVVDKIEQEIAHA